jgi:nucleotide-binding universal stress UspA family protein
MYEQILVPTDGSTGTAHVAMQAFDLADRYEADVHLLYVMEDDVGNILTSGQDAKTEQREYGRQAIQPLREMSGVYGVETTTEIREGDPSEEILEAASEIDVDVIVMGTHGRSGVERRLIGSVAERVVRHATQSVLTVRLPRTDRTVGDESEAAEIARNALSDADHTEIEIGGTDRQQNVWIVEATADGTRYNVYLDPVTRRTRSVRRTAP